MLLKLVSRWNKFFSWLNTALLVLIFIALAVWEILKPLLVNRRTLLAVGFILGISLMVFLDMQRVQWWFFSP